MSAEVSLFSYIKSKDDLVQGSGRSSNAF